MILPFILACIAVVLFGTPGVEQQEYQQLMAQRTPDSAFLTGNGSGYFEIMSTIEANRNEGLRALDRFADVPPWALLPLAYALLLACLLVASCRNISGWQRLALPLSCLAPLAATFVASDVYRWIGMSANLSLLALLYFGARQQLTFRLPLVHVILLFSLLAPFGDADLQRPFPAHQRLLELL